MGNNFKEDCVVMVATVINRESGKSVSYTHLYGNFPVTVVNQHGLAEAL